MSVATISTISNQPSLPGKLPLGLEKDPKISMARNKDQNQVNTPSNLHFNLKGIKDIALQKIDRT